MIRPITLNGLRLQNFLALTIIIIIIMWDQDLSFGVGLKALFINNNASEEEKVLGKTP